MIKVMSLLSLLSISLVSQAYIVHTFVIKDSAQPARNAILYGDLHHADGSIEFAFADKHKSLLSKKIKNKKKKTIVCYEGQNTSCCGLKSQVLNPFLEKDLLIALGKANEQEKLNLVNVENRSFLVDATLLAARIKFGKNLDNQIAQLKKEVARVRKKHGSADSKAKNLAFELERLEYLQKAPSEKELITNILTSLENEKSAIEKGFKEGLKSNKLKKEQVAVLRKYLDRCMKKSAFAQKKLVQMKEGKRALNARIIDELIPTTSDIFDLNFVLNYLTNATEQHVLVAGCAHTENICKILSDLGCTVTYEAGIRNSQLSYHPTYHLPGPIKESDFNYIV